MKKACSKPGCPNVVSKGAYCERHAPAIKAARNAEYDRRRASDPALAAAAAIRNSRDWQRARRMKLDQDPICQDPHGIHGSNPPLAKQVHHIKPLATHPELAFHAANLMSVCTRCHDVFNRMERKATGGRD